MGVVRQLAADAVSSIERFVASCEQPALIEPGEDPFPLTAGTYSLDQTPRGLSLSCWTPDRTWTRRILRAGPGRDGRLLLTTERFGKREGTATLADLAQRKDVLRDGRRWKFREQFRRFLSRQFSGWRIAEISTGADLEHSLSPAYSRALLTRGTASYAAIGAPLDSQDPQGVLTFGLIWLDYLRRRAPDRYIEGLAIFVPNTAARVTCDRVRHLRGARFQVFAHAEEGDDYPLDLADYGNFSTKVEPRLSSVPVPAWLRPVLDVTGVAAIELAAGGASLRLRGLEFVRVAPGGEVTFGIDRMRPGSLMHAPEILSLARGLAELRSSDAGSQDPLYRRFPEAWLESMLRPAIDQIDANLFGSPVYGQVPAFAGGDRGLIDLLASDRDGRLAVIEVKASADIHLPLQALDYWMRVKWHLERDEFTQSGYFPGLPLRKDTPKLYLVATAMEFHPANETVLRYFASGIQVQRVGLSLEWRQRLRVVCRSGETASFQNPSFHSTRPAQPHVTGRSQRNPSSDLESESG